MKTSFAQDIALFPVGRIARLLLLVAAALLICAPLLVNAFLLSQLIFVLIYVVAGIGMQVLFGFAGQVSLGHAAFLAIGAYAATWLQARGVDGVAAFAVASILAGIVGLVIALPALRMSGLYLVIATLAFAFIVEEVATRWSSVTGGNNGVSVPSVRLFGLPASKPEQLFYACLVVAAAAMWLGKNVLRTGLGRAMLAVRDSEVAAQCMGVPVARTKALAFAISAALCGMAGALYANAIGYITPDQFTVTVSLDLIILVLLGGLASLRGVVFGAIFLVMLPQLIRAITGVLVPGTGEIPGVRPLASGGILILVMLFEQGGLEGLWSRISRYATTVPLYRKGTLGRQRGIIRSERW